MKALASSSREFARAAKSKAGVYPTQTALEKAKKAERETLDALKAAGWGVIVAEPAPQRFEEEVTDLGVANLDGAVRAHVRSEAAQHRSGNHLPLDLTHPNTVTESRRESTNSSGWAFRGEKRTRSPELDEDTQ